MTMLQEAVGSGHAARAQSLLPFDERDLLAIRLLPAEFARAASVSKQTVSRWIRTGKIILGADGRLDPNVAMRQVLRNCDPGRARSRLVRQAYSDMAGLRAEAARSSDLEQRLVALEAQRVDEAIASDRDYEKIDRWLNEFERRMGDVDIRVRSHLDADGWRALVRDTLSRIMDVDASLDQFDETLVAEIAHLDINDLEKQIADLAGFEPFSILRGIEEEEGEGA